MRSPEMTVEASRRLPPVQLQTSGFAYPPALVRVEARFVSSTFLKDSSTSTVHGVTVLERHLANKRRRLIADAEYLSDVTRSMNGHPRPTQTSSAPDNLKPTTPSTNPDTPTTPDIPKEPGEDTIVIHVNSQTLQLGRASDVIAKIVPQADAEADKLYLLLKQRLKELKIRTNVGAAQQVIQFNQNVQAETIQDHNDPYKVEWTDVMSRKPSYLVGKDALHIPYGQPDTPYTLFYPMKHGMLNTDAYTSLQQVRGDLALIWTDSIVSQLHIPVRDFYKYRVLLVVPDLLPRKVVEDVFMNILLSDCGFASILVQTESVCACYGAGLSSATVVDIGDSCTKVNCVDDGAVLPISRINLKYGMADVRALLFHQLKRHGFPYKELDLSRPWTQKLIKELGDTMLSLSEEDAITRVYDFYVREPASKAKKYQVKAFDEPLAAAMALFSPSAFDFVSKTPKHCSWGSDVGFRSSEGILTEWHRGVFFPKAQLQLDDDFSSTAAANNVSGNATGHQNTEGSISSGAIADDAMVEGTDESHLSKKSMGADDANASGVLAPGDDGSDAPLGIAKTEGEEKRALCAWNDCAFEATSPSVLYDHILQEHAPETSGSDSSWGTWTCGWKGCMHPAIWKNQTSILAHIALHCLGDLQASATKSANAATPSQMDLDTDDKDNDLSQEDAASNDVVGLHSAIALALAYAAPTSQSMQQPGASTLQPDNQQLDSLARQQRLASSILITGGGSFLRGLHAYLKYQLQLVMPGVEVGLVSQSRVDLMWKGGSLMSRLEAFAPSWISREEWLNVSTILPF